jgi:hypothetical protein
VEPTKRLPRADRAFHDLRAVSCIAGRPVAGRWVTTEPVIRYLWLWMHNRRRAPAAETGHKHQQARLRTTEAALPVRGTREHRLWQPAFAGADPCEASDTRRRLASLRPATNGTASARVEAGFAIARMDPLVTAP